MEPPDSPIESGHLKTIVSRVSSSWNSLDVIDHLKEEKPFFFNSLEDLGASLVAQTVKNMSAMWETWVLSLGWDDSLEEGTASHSSILAWRIPCTEEPGRLQSMGSQRVGHSWVNKLIIERFSECLWFYKGLEKDCNSSLFFFPLGS